MKAKKAERTDRTSMTFPAGVWRAYAAWCRSNGWYPSHRISVFLEKELERAGIDWRADSSFADVELGNVKKTLGVKPETRTEYSWGNYIPSGEAVEPEPVHATESPREDEDDGIDLLAIAVAQGDHATDSPVEVVEPEVMEPEEDEFASINKMFKL